MHGSYGATAFARHSKASKSLRVVVRKEAEPSTIGSIALVVAGLIVALHRRQCAAVELPGREDEPASHASHEMGHACGPA